MYNKEELINAIWDNPNACTGMEWVRRGATWQSCQRLDGSETTRRDKSILRMHNGQLFVNYNGGSFPQGQDIWKYLQWRWSINDFVEVLQRVGEIYGIQPDLSGYSEEQQKRAQQRTEMRKVANVVANDVLGAAGQEPAAIAYLNGRGLQGSERLGAISSNIKETIIVHLREAYPFFTIERANEIMRGYFPTIRKDYTTAKTGVFIDFIDHYRLAAPYYNGSGNIAGFWLRCTDETAPTFTNEKGEVQTMPKYVYSKGMPKGGYCMSLRSGEPVLMVEGMLDAEALQQAGYANVIAVGGQTPTENEEDAAKSVIATLKRYNVEKVVYFPDYEFTKQGELATGATQRTITALLPCGLKSISIANLETAEAREAKGKVDIAEYIRLFGADRVAGLLHDAEPWYYYRLHRVAVERGNSAEEMAEAAKEVYDSISNPVIREQIKRASTQATDGYLLTLKNAGFTAAAMSMIDKQGLQTALPQRMAEIGAELMKQHSAEEFARLLAKANRVQHANSYCDFVAQVDATKEQLHNAVAQKPEYLTTTWKLWKENPADSSSKYNNRYISFAPAAVSLVAAPTNHGKTLMILQTAINLATATHKRFLYLSTENDAEQLYVRALTAYIGKAWKEDEPNPRNEVRQYIKSQDLPKELFNMVGGSLNIGEYDKKYWEYVAPHLSLVRTPTDIDALYNNCTAVVEDWENKGIEVGGIFIDYIQQLHATGKAFSRTDEMKIICDRLNDMAKAFGVPVICAAQLNRDATKAGSEKLDGIELANIGESAGIENIAEDCYLVWQVDKIKPTDFVDKNDNFKLDASKYRTRRCFSNPEKRDTLRSGYLYIENLKARDYATGGYCLLPFNGAAGCITSTESEK